MRRALMAGALSVVLTGGSMAMARPAVAADFPPGHTVLVLCVNKIINLPLLDLPDEPLTLGVGISADFKCPHERVG
jgi:hypothetical protein